MDTDTTRTKIPDVTDWGAGRTGRLLGVQEIAELTGLTPARVDQLSRQQGFPKPYDTLSAKTRRPIRIWKRETIEKWWLERGGRGGGR